MTDHEQPPETDIPVASAKPRGRTISAIWVIPLVAALIGGWLVFGSATEEKAFAEIVFDNASGLEAGKTAVKLRNVKVGIVKGVRFSNDLAKVIVLIELTGVKQERLTDTTRFWVVKPRVGIGGISGLDTLLSGAYIELDPGEGGEPATRFTGLEEPQNYQLGNPGTTYVLRAGKLGSLSIGSPVKYRGIQVGKVIRYKLSEDHASVEIEIFVHSPHDSFVTEHTRFWNVSGFEAEVGAKGVRLDLDSVASLIAGGIMFSSNDETGAAEQAPEGTLFTLYDTEKPGFEEARSFGAPLKLYFDSGVSGLSVGAPVEFKGLRLGTVTRIGVETNKRKDNILTFAIIDIEPERLPGMNKASQPDDRKRLETVYRYLEKMVARGLRAQITTGNLLTGQTLVTLDMFPDAKKASVRYVDGMPILPTVPETLTGLLTQASRIMRKIEALRLEKISADLEETTTNINNLVKSLNAAEGGILGLQAAEALEELTRAARSIRSTAEYLERHPEALVKGKQPD